MTITEQIKHSIQLVPTMDTDTLSHTWKIYHLKNSKEYEPFLKAIETELKKRTKPIKEPTDETNS